MILPSPELDDFGLCPFALATGKPCVLCGGTRALLEVVRGDFDRALSLNAFVVVAIPLAGVWTISHMVFALRQAHGSEARAPRVLLRLQFFTPLIIALAGGWTWNLGRW